MNREFRNRVINQAFDKNSFLLNPKNNLVLMRVYHNTEKTTTGIWVGDKQWEPAHHAERVFEVVQVPEKLYFNPEDSQYTMPWLTNVEVKVGDIAWCDYLLALNCWRFEYEGQEYRTIPYQSIYVVRRKKAVICCNGYCLFEPIYKTESYGYYSIKKVYKRFGRVKYIGKPNEDYAHNSKYHPTTKVDWCDDFVNIKPDDLVVFDKAEKLCVMLESREHAMFDGLNMYRVSQRHRILGVLENYQE